MSQKLLYYRYILRGGRIMSKKVIYAKTFLEKSDFYHLAKQFYKHIYRHPELEEEIEWQTIKLAAEDFLVEQRHTIGIEVGSSSEDYRDFLQFYTGLEVKYEDPTEFIFNENEKKALLKEIL